MDISSRSTSGFDGSRGIQRSIENKDAHDVYKILRAVDTETLATGLKLLIDLPFSAASARKGMNYFKTLFAAGSRSPGSQMAGAAEQDFGNSALVSKSTTLLAEDLLSALGSDYL